MISRPRRLHIPPLLLAATAWAQEVTNGPVAGVTLAERIEWSTARECAAACLRYNGIWHCGVNGGYYDLGVELKCGCASINGCYCNTKLASSASSYISACVSSRCEAVDDLTRDLSDMIGLYDSYCVTAMVAAEENGPRPTEDAENDTNDLETTEAAPQKTVSSGDSPKQTSNSGATSTSTSEESQGGSDASDGLSRSDIVALAASLGVGIPSLLLAGLTLYFQLRKKKRTAEANAARTNSMVDVMPIKQARHGGGS